MYYLFQTIDQYKLPWKPPNDLQRTGLMVIPPMLRRPSLIPTVASCSFVAQQSGIM